MVYNGITNIFQFSVGSLISIPNLPFKFPYSIQFNYSFLLVSFKRIIFQNMYVDRLGLMPLKFKYFSSDNVIFSAQMLPLFLFPEKNRLRVYLLASVFILEESHPSTDLFPQFNRNICDILIEISTNQDIAHEYLLVEIYLISVES